MRGWSQLRNRLSQQRLGRFTARTSEVRRKELAVHLHVVRPERGIGQSRQERVVVIATEPEDEATATAIQRMLDDGAPTPLPRRVRRSRWSPLDLADEPPAAERAALRRAARRVFRVYCFACGRASEVLVAPLRPGRCAHCDGTMLVDVVPD